MLKQPLGNEWQIEVCNSSANLTPFPTTHWTTLVVPDLPDLVKTAIKNQTAFVDKIGYDRSGKSQPAVELRRLLAFSNRLQNEEETTGPIVIGPSELPISFNGRIFKGDFISNQCMLCGLNSTPEETQIEDFYDETGRQEYGEFRVCNCGDRIAYTIDGYGRP